MAESTSIWEMMEHIVFNNTAAALINGDQGIYLVHETKTLYDEVAENICKFLRKPGGTAIGGGVDLGVKVSGKAE